MSECRRLLRASSGDFVGVVNPQVGRAANGPRVVPCRGAEVDFYAITGGEAVSAAFVLPGPETQPLVLSKRCRDVTDGKD
jgi:hypothetical protein